MANREKIAVLMSTYNGAMYIREQLDTILNQNCEEEIKLFIRDDGSSDDTFQILKEYEMKNPNILLLPRDTNNYGSANGFMYLLNYVLKEFPGEFQYFAFADQDDYWLIDKLMVGISSIKEIEKPALYFSKKRIVDYKLKELNLEDKFFYQDSFLQYFTMSNAYGCTFVFNERLAKMSKNKPIEKLIHHDAWIYRVAGCIDSEIVVDDNSYILYRQHESNVVGKVEYWNIRMVCKRILKKRNHILQKTYKEIWKQFPEDLNKNARKIVPLVCGYTKNIKQRIQLLLWKESRSYGLKTSLMWMIKVMLNGL